MRTVLSHQLRLFFENSINQENKKKEAIDMIENFWTSVLEWEVPRFYPFLGFYAALPIFMYWLSCSVCYWGGLDSIKNIKNPKNNVTVNQTVIRVIQIHVLQSVGLYLQEVNGWWSPPFFQPKLHEMRLVYLVAGPLVMDTVEYFSHRLFHAVPWLYRHVHKTHHKLKTSWSFGALYNSFPDAVTVGLALNLTYLVCLGYSVAEFSWVISVSNVFTVLDHVDYFDNVEWLGKKNHHRHHHEINVQKNFQQPFFTFWDTWLGTKLQQETMRSKTHGDGSS